MVAALLFAPRQPEELFQGRVCQLSGGAFGRTQDDIEVTRHMQRFEKRDQPQCIITVVEDRDVAVVPAEP